MSDLRVTALHVQDVLGVEEFDLAPGRVTLIKGKNASGKSTLLSSVQAALGRGSLAKLARVDPGGKETSPEVCLVLDGQGEHYRVERKGDKVRVRRRVGDTAALEDVPRPQEFLAGLFDPTCSNPVRFLTAPDKDRAILLLEALLLKMDRAELLLEMGVAADEVGPIPVGLHPLEETAIIRDRIFTARTGVNRDEKAAAQAADQLRRNIPAELPEDPAAAIAALERRVDTLASVLGAAEEAAAGAQRQTTEAARAAHDLAVEKITGDFKSAAKDRRAAFAAWEATVRAALELQIKTEKEKVEAEIGALMADDEGRLAKVDDARDDAIHAAATVRATAEAELVALRNTVAAKREQLAALREQARTAERDRALADQAAKFDRQRDTMKAEADRLSRAIEALDAYRRRMAENLPIPGLSIEGKEIRVNGVPYEQLNTQARIDIAVKVATLRAKGQRLPILFVDGAEALDREHFDALVARLAAENVQAFIARVSDEGLEVERPAEVGA